MYDNGSTLLDANMNYEENHVHSIEPRKIGSSFGGKLFIKL